MTDDPGTPEDLLESLDAQACGRLLAAAQLGRLAVVVDGRPRIIVLNHIVDAGVVLFRTGEHALLADLTEGGGAPQVAYEVDSAFPPGHTGWSVIATGRLVREPDAARVQLARGEISAWAEGERDLVLRLDIDQLTGRRAGRA